MSGRIILIFLVLTLPFSCVEPIDLDIDREGGQLVVYGHIDDGSGPFFVQLQRTTAIPNRFQAETGARLTLHDDLGREGRFRTANEEGIYFYNAFTMPIEAGRTYTLRIRTAGMDFYESEPETIPTFEAQSQVEVNFDRIEVNTGSFDAIVTKDIMQIRATTILENPNARYFIRYFPTQTYRLDPTNFPDPFNSRPAPCFVTRPVEPENLPLYTSSGFEGLRIPSIFLGQQEIDYAFRTRNIISVETHTISEAAYRYWRKVSILLNSTGSIFDTPPAAIRGNIYNTGNPEEDVLGFFEASNIYVSRVEKWRGDFPYPVPEDPCAFDPNRSDYPNYCIDCLILEGSSFMRPPYY